jgi:hypothetical protein
MIPIVHPSSTPQPKLPIAVLSHYAPTINRNQDKAQKKENKDL